MKIHSRALIIALVIAIAVAVAVPVQAGYPKKPVTLVSPYGPGGLPILRQETYRPP